MRTGDLVIESGGISKADWEADPDNWPPSYLWLQFWWDSGEGVEKVENEEKSSWNWPSHSPLHTSHISFFSMYRAGVTWDQVNQGGICLTRTSALYLFCPILPVSDQHAQQVERIDLYIEPSCPYPCLDLPWNVNMERKEDFCTRLDTQNFWYSTTVEVNFCLHVSCIQSGCWSSSLYYAPFSSYSPLLQSQYQETSSNATSKTPSQLLLLLTQTARAPQPGVMEQGNMLLPSLSMEIQLRLIW